MACLPHVWAAAANELHVRCLRENHTIQRSIARRTHRLVTGTTFHFCREDQRSAYEYLIVDEAGQMALGNLVAAAGAAREVVLVRDQMQLPQPVQRCIRARQDSRRWSISC